MMIGGKEKAKFNEALKLFDNKDYKTCKRSCEKILEKQPNNSDAIALKGLVMTYLSQKEEGIKTLNQAIRMNFSNPNSWHFLALHHKEEKNYTQAMKCYLQAMKNDPTNFNVLRDLSYLQLYLRHYHSFLDTARKGVDLRPGLAVNWVTYAFANYLTKNYEFAFKLLESCDKIAPVKPQEKNEIVLFQTHMLRLQNKNVEAIKFLEENKNFVLDKTFYYENLISLSRTVPEKYDFCLESVQKALEINSENLNYYLSFLEVSYNKTKTEQEAQLLKLEKFEDIVKAASDESVSKSLFDSLLTLKSKFKSRILVRLDLALSQGAAFKALAREFLGNQIKQNIPSVFINLKFIYKIQQNKIQILDEIVTEFLSDLKTNEKIIIQKESGESLVLDIVPEFIWVYYFAAQHFDFMRNLEKALEMINLAIDKTPTVVEFYMVKSKIFEHAGLYEKAAEAYEKAKKLDLGDRYLNAKHAKKYVRLSNVDKANEIMKDFVRDPLIDENIDHFQNMWYETECAYAYLRNKNFVKAHRLFNSISIHFNTIIEDQFDFYNYCLRRFMINDFANVLEHMDKILNNKYVFKMINGMELLLKYLELEKDKAALEKEFTKEAEKLKAEKIEKYSFKDISTMQADIEKTIYSICTKVQSYTKDKYLHKVAVKIFAKKNKYLLALKSLLLLQKNYPESEEFISSMEIFSQYFQENQSKLKDNVTSILKNYLPIIFNESEFEDFVKKGREKINAFYNANQTNYPFDHSIALIKDFSYFPNEQIKLAEVEKAALDAVNSDKISLRKVISEKSLLVEVFLSMFCNEEALKKFKTEYEEKIRIENVAEKDISGNLGFYVEYFNEDGKKK